MKWRISRGAEILGNFDLGDGEYVIGSGESAHLQVASNSIAAEHARFRIGRDLVEVEDLGSGLGTWIGEQPVSGVERVASGSCLQLGDLAVQFWNDEPARAEAPSRFVVG